MNSAANSSVTIALRPIDRGDNEILARIIRAALIEFNANQHGSAFDDKSTDSLATLFQTNRSAYYVAVFNSMVVGGAGIYPTIGLPPDICELARMYLVPSARGLGIGKMLMEKCLHAAKEAGFKKIYLETKTQLLPAIKLYEQYGFGYSTEPLGNSGHYGCDTWMIKKL